MRIAIDGRMLGVEGTGVATYAAGLAEALRSTGLAPEVIDDGGSGARRGRAGLWLSALSGRRRLSAAEGRLIARDVFRAAHVRFRMTGRLTELSVAGPAGLVHWTYPLPLRIAGWRNLYTVHDLIPITHPELTPIPAARHARVLRALARTADRFVTVSQAARADIVARLGCAPHFVVDCGQRVDVAGAAGGALPDGLETGGYFVTIAPLEPRKNIVRLVAAHGKSGVSTPLLIVGAQGWRSAEAEAAIATAPGVIWAGALPRGQLLDCLAKARAMLFPSLAEGFGLPVAEAMALGVPVLTARGGALEEVAGGAALLADPIDIADIAQGIARLDSDAALRQALAAAGRSRAEAFTTARFAARLRDCYDEVLRDG